jgi:hypothetical protein
VKSKRRGSKLAKPDMAKITELVYDEIKFTQEKPPNLIFVPSRDVLLKLMRVCCECKDTVELHYLL